MRICRDSAVQYTQLAPTTQTNTRAPGLYSAISHSARRKIFETTKIAMCNARKHRFRKCEP